MARHTMEAVPSIRLVRDAVPEEFEEALLWALAKVPADRPQSAAQLAEALGTPLAATATRRAPSRMRVTPARISGARRPVAWYRRPWVLATVAGVGVAAGGGAWLALQGARAAAPAAGELDPRRVAVLYFEDRGVGRLSYLAEGLTEGLIAALRDVAALRVVSPSGVAQVRGHALPLDSVARRLEAGTLVRGEVEEDGGDVRVTVRLVDGGSGAEFERASFRRAAGEPLQLRDDLVQQVERLVRTRLGTEIRLRGERAGTRSVEAWVSLQRAQRLVKQADSAGAAGDSAAFGRWAAEADSVAAVAERTDARWTEPIVLRAQLAYRRSRRAVEDPLAAHRWIAAGLEHVERALALERGDPDALELRGNLQYWKWLLGLEPDAGRAEALLQAAQADLELAVRQRPLQAGAWATLSHLYNNSPTKTSVDVVLAARSAYEADAFLANADVVLARLFFGTYDLGQFVEARHWCAEGARRFPANPRFAECALWLLTTRAEDPDPARAWRLLDTLMSRTPESDTAYQRLNGRLAVAAVLARAGLADSARAVAAGARGTPDLDPSRDLANIAAFVYTLLGDTTAALEQLASYLAANPARRAAYAEDPGWWFRGLDTHPGFRRLVGRNR
jgi:serine/threonine-protein kinase